MAAVSRAAGQNAFGVQVPEQSGRGPAFLGLRLTAKGIQALELEFNLASGYRE
jgi:hypothetical protein